MWFIFDANLGMGKPNIVKACAAHAAVLLRAAFSVQEQRGDDWLTLLIEPTKAVFEP